MAFPAILRRLFANNGAGPLLRSDIIPRDVPKGLIAPFYKVTFGGSDGRRPIFWGQSAANEGWVLCDGGSDGTGGNVPNLKDRMIIGAGGSYASGAAGGATTHSHSMSGTVGSVTLSEGQMPSHRHGIKGASGMGSQNGSADDLDNWPGAIIANTEYTGGSQSHTHSLSASTYSVNNMPPYFALAYLVKL